MVLKASSGIKSKNSMAHIFFLSELRHRKIVFRRGERHHQIRFLNIPVIIILNQLAYIGWISQRFIN